MTILVPNSERYMFTVVYRSIFEPGVVAVKLPFTTDQRGIEKRIHSFEAKLPIVEKP